MREGRK